MLTLKLSDSTQRHLPLMVVGAVAWAGTGLLFSAHVEAQVVYVVVGLMAVHVIDKLVRTERSPEILRHYPSVLQQWLATTLHGPIHRQQVIWDLSWRYCYVSPLVGNSESSFSAVIEPAVRAVFNGCDGTSTAIASKCRASYFVPSLRCWTLSRLSASWAQKKHHRSRSPEVLGHIWPLDNRWVIQWADIWTPRQQSSPLMKAITIRHQYDTEKPIKNGDV